MCLRSDPVIFVLLICVSSCQTDRVTQITGRTRNPLGGREAASSPPPPAAGCDLVLAMLCRTIKGDVVWELWAI